jgi:hypothetical protein
MKVWKVALAMTAIAALGLTAAKQGKDERKEPQKTPSHPDKK